MECWQGCLMEPTALPKSMAHISSIVMEFLRNQTVQLPDSISVLRQIQQEAEFFAIAGLLAAVKQKLLERRVRVEIHVERFRCSDDGCNCGAGQKVEVSALEGLAFFDCELFHPRRELRPNWTTPSASLLVTLHPEADLEPAIEAVHHAILCADEVCEQSAKEIVLEEGSPVRRALGDLAATPEMCYLQWYARANEYKVGDTRDPSLQYHATAANKGFVRSNRLGPAFAWQDMGMLGVCRKVWQTEGVRGFFRGVLPPLMGSSAYRSAQFAVFEAVYTRQKELGWDEVTIPGTGGLAFATVLAGICGSSTRAVIESPIEYAKETPSDIL
eukprot:g20214.t1